MQENSERSSSHTKITSSLLNKYNRYLSDNVELYKQIKEATYY